MDNRKGDMVQIHMLTAYPASLLNRDDAGLAKRIPFGGVMRTRISSQCLKKHWRESPDVTELGDLAHRSRVIYEYLVAQPLIDDHDASEEEAAAIAGYLLSETIEGGADESLRTGQVVVLTEAETRFLRDEAVNLLSRLREAAVEVTSVKDVKKHAPIDKKGLGKILEELPASLDTALFGRFVTSDIFARVDAAVSVAHAFTTHAEAAETDYFTAIDTLTKDEPGAALIQDTELTSGVFYLYAVINMEQLRDNLGKQADLAAKLGANLVRAMATVSPGAKRGSTAPYAYAEFVLIERGSYQPRTLANAFMEPVPSVGGNLMQESANRLLQYHSGLAEMYGAGNGRAVLSTIHAIPEDTRIPQQPLDLAITEVFSLDS